MIEEGREAPGNLGGDERAVRAALRVDVVSLFPEMFAAVASAGITGRALVRGIWSLKAWNPRDFTRDAYRRVDDRPYGGGPGMVMLAEPLSAALSAAREAQRAQGQAAGPVIFLSPDGEPLGHRRVEALAALPAMILLAGRYEGVDQRLVDAEVDLTVSIGDFVVSGGELPAMMLIDAVVRLQPGVMNDTESVVAESFATGLLDHPHFTRPEHFRGVAVPEVLTSGDHRRIAAWRRAQALARTLHRRPELIERARAEGRLDADDERWVAANASTIQAPPDPL